MAAPSTTYEPRCPAQTALYQIVRDHLETFRVQAACLRDGEGLPRFVEQEFRNFLQCGWLAGGFALIEEAAVIDRILRHLDQRNPDDEYGLNAMDQTHKIVIAPMVRLPFGNGQRFLNSKGVLNSIVGGWCRLPRASRSDRFDRGEPGGS